jgi:hypothetical protein
MSNYTIAVNWSGKDALSDSDAAKVISGSDFNTEFTTVRTAVNSKADTNGDSGEDFAANNVTIAGTLNVTGVPTIPTASAGTNTTQAASTAFVTTAVAAVDKAVINGHAYPVGSIFTSVVATNPATLLGVGTWVAFGEGKVIIGIDSGDTDFDTVEETGGAKTGAHTLTTSELPAHDHDIKVASGGNTGTYGARINAQTSSGYIATDTTSITNTGDGSAHSHPIVQPYIVVYMWKRTA